MQRQRIDISAEITESGEYWVRKRKPVCGFCHSIINGKTYKNQRDFYFCDETCEHRFETEVEKDS